MENRGNHEARLICLENAASVSANQRYFDMIAMLAIRLGHREKARQAVEKLRGVDPRVFQEAHNYYMLFLEFGYVTDVERMFPFLREFAPPGKDLSMYYSGLEKAKADSTYPAVYP